MPRILVLLRNLLRRRREEKGLDEELRSYIDMLVDQKMAEGLSEQEAKRIARLHLGCVDQVKEAVRDVRLGTTLQQVVQDIRYATRGLRRHSGFTFVAVLTFAFGIGANTAMFALFDAVLLRVLPLAEPQQLFLLNEINPREQGPASLSWPGFERLRKAAPAGAQLIALSETARFNMTSINGELEPVSEQLISGDYFRVLGVRAAIGRVLNEDDNRNPGASPVAVLSHSAWVKRFGADDQVIGRDLVINGAVVKIVGVAEPGFYGVALGESPDLWLPLMMQHEVRYVHNVASHNGDPSKPWPPQENLYWLRALARVASPATEASVVAALNVSFEHEQDLGAKQIGLPRDRRLALESGARGFNHLRSGFAEPLKVLLTMVALLLVVACANIASLVVARGTARRREFAVRLSLGASRSRLLRQLLTENLLLSAIGGLFGVLLAVWAMPLLPRILSIPVTLDLDLRILGFAAALSFTTGLAFGAIPAFQGTGVDLNSALKSGPSGSSPGKPRIFGGALIVSQIALSFVLVTGATLLGQSLLNLMRADLGFDREHVITAVLDPQSAGLSPRNLPAMYAQLVERVASEPGVRAAAISVSSLVGGGEQSSGIHVPGYVPVKSERPGTKENFISPGYFTIMGMRLLRGRDFNERDSAGGAPVAIINESFARRYFAERNPIGMRYGYSSGHSGFEIVGVVADAKTVNPKQPAQPAAYRPLSQDMQFARSLEVRTEGDPRAFVLRIRKLIAEVAPGLPVIEVATLSDRVERTIRRDRLLSHVTTFFACLALLLACIGVYGLVSYRVVRRTVEFGIRMALGARRRDVVWTALAESLLLLVIGIAVGVVLSLAGTKLMQGLVFGLRPNDPLIFVLAGIFTAAVALLSAGWPAGRATRIDPNITLRHE